MFDSGGLSLKTSSGMETMKTDMSGGGRGARRRCRCSRAVGVKTKVTAYVPMVENMPSGTAIRPGDVLKIRNGKTVEVLNTDAEGRLILADALSLASEDEPDAIIDLATLTGACMVALGDKIAGLMGNDDGWSDQVRDAADATGERVWPLPLPKEYRKLLESEVADLRNISTGGYGGALTAGLFLAGVRRRRAVGAPRHRRTGPGRWRRRLRPEGRHRVRRAHARRARRGLQAPDPSEEEGQALMRRLRERFEARSPFPAGSATVAAWLVVTGITAYLFLTFAGRELGSDRFGALAVLWALVFFAGPGFFQPLEQEVARALGERRALGLGGAPLVRRAALAGGVFAVTLSIITLVVGLTVPAVADSVFDGEKMLVVALCRSRSSPTTSST